jgi:putative transposase
MMRQAWVEDGNTVAVVRQCVLAGVSRATVYAHQRPKPVDEGDLLLSGLIDEEYTRRPFYGSRKMVVFLATVGHGVNRKRVQRLMRLMGLVGMAPGPNTSRPHPDHEIYPYLLRGVAVVRPNQVWSTDITYIRLPHGLAYLVAIVDWYSRRVLSWRISNSMEAVFCVDCLEDALRIHGKPEVFNSDQGSQFTSAAFTGVLKREDIVISMDGRGRAFDNIFVERLWRSVKHEDVYLKGYASMGELLVGLAQYFAFYNGERSRAIVKSGVWNPYSMTDQAANRCCSCSCCFTGTPSAKTTPCISSAIRSAFLIRRHDFWASCTSLKDRPRKVERVTQFFVRVVR